MSPRIRIFIIHVLASQLHFLANRNAEQVAPSLLWPVNCIKIGGDVALRGLVYTYADVFENGDIFLRFALASTRKRRLIWQPKTEVFENALKVEILENVVFVFTCGRAKTKVFENDDVIIGSSLLQWPIATREQQLP